MKHPHIPSTRFAKTVRDCASERQQPAGLYEDRVGTWDFLANSLAELLPAVHGRDVEEHHEVLSRALFFQHVEKAQWACVAWPSASRKRRCAGLLHEGPWAPRPRRRARFKEADAARDTSVTVTCCLLLPQPAFPFSEPLNHHDRSDDRCSKHEVSSML